MEKINVPLENINQVSEEYFNERIEKRFGIIKVTTESYYQLYETDEATMKKLAEEWFVKAEGRSHAYRDGAKYPISNLVKVEIVKR